jgi:transmembrane sensor
VTANGAGRLQPVITLLGGSVAAWQQGRLSFTATPLAEALAEFERYGDTGLVIRDPAVAAMPIGGSYNVREFQRFAEALPQVLPVRLERRGSAIEVVRRPP